MVMFYKKVFADFNVFSNFKIHILVIQTNII